jgi:DNA-binding transcriptional ArsR family regulator
VAVMDYLAEQDEASCSHIAIRIKCSQPTTTQHLIKLRRAGLVTTRRDKQTIYNRLADGVVWP